MKFKKDSKILKSDDNSSSTKLPQKPTSSHEKERNETQQRDVPSRKDWISLFNCSKDEHPNMDTQRDG